VFVLPGVTIGRVSDRGGRRSLHTTRGSDVHRRWRARPGVRKEDVLGE
jgi:hypothetical protein